MPEIRGKHRIVFSRHADNEAHRNTHEKKRTHQNRPAHRRGSGVTERQKARREAAKLYTRVIARKRRTEQLLRQKEQAEKRKAALRKKFAPKERARTTHHTAPPKRNISDLVNFVISRLPATADNKTIRIIVFLLHKAGCRDITARQIKKRLTHSSAPHI